MYYSIVTAKGECVREAAGDSANPHLAGCCLALLVTTLLLMAWPGAAADAALPPCARRPTFVDPPWVDATRFCAEEVYVSAENEALAFAALAVAADGTLYAASPLRGEVWALRDRDGDGLPEDAQRVLTGLTLPSGLDWSGDALYISGGAQIWRLRDGAREAELLVADLPVAAGQWGGDLVVGAEGELFVSLSAACATCDTEEAASILGMATDGSRRRTLARGLRQPSGLALREGELWVTDSAGRADEGGDALNRVREGAHFGWPGCAGPAETAGAGCAERDAPALVLPAGSRPYGLAWYAHDALPGLRDSLLVTLHGSRQRVDLRGYALAAVGFDAAGEVLEAEVILPGHAGESDFSVARMNSRGSGFWPERPLDVAVSPEGWIYLSMTGGRILALRPV